MKRMLCSLSMNQLSRPDDGSDTVPAKNTLPSTFFSHGYYETSFKDRGYCATYVISACLKKRDKCVTNPIYFAIVENDWQFCSLESFFSFQNAHWVACGESTLQTSVSLRQMQPLIVMAQQSMFSLSLL